MVLFECGNCLTECYADKKHLLFFQLVCVQCGADLSNEMVVSDYDHDEDDGQPSEVQEWNDFDPDC